MIVIVDDREMVVDGYKSGFSREGIASTGFDPEEFQGWLGAVSKTDLSAVEAFLIGNSPQREKIPGTIKTKSGAPVIAMSEDLRLDGVLELFSCGVDDVVRKPVHVREILARVRAILSRQSAEQSEIQAGQIKIYPDGRTPLVNNKPFSLPRREYRILEYLVSNKDKRVTKSQLFNVVYGLFEESVEESVVESHVSKLRKKLRAELGYDPVDSKRYLGYCLHTQTLEAA